eukprot:5139897-Pleurochrysis_carterae.AAC.1
MRGWEVESIPRVGRGVLAQRKGARGEPLPSAPDASGLNAQPLLKHKASGRPARLRSKVLRRAAKRGGELAAAHELGEAKVGDLHLGREKGERRIELR